MSTAQTVLDLDQLCVNTMRTLAIDAIQQANSGHPGTPMGMSPTVYCLWQRLLRFDPEDPIWMNRDRFVLSSGHASTLLYTMLHLAKVKAVDPEYEILGRPSVTLDDLKSFRQFGSRCAGHPEYRWTSGVETTTGPLGQGVATSVGMAIAEKWLAARYNRPEFDLFGYRIYAVCGDGCMMEGISSEAASLAGHLKLDNLCWIYDNNHITIEGKTDLAFTEDVAGRFLAYGWNVLRVGDANDLDRIENALKTAAATPGRPSIVIVDSHIGYGSPHRQDTSAAHGKKKSSSQRGHTAGRRTPSFLCPAEFTSTSKPALDGEAAKRASSGRSDSASTATNFRSSPPNSIRFKSGGCRPVGRRTFPCFRPMRREFPGAMRPRKF